MALEVQKHKRKISSAQVIALGYFIVILLGSLLLTLPFASKAREWTRYDNALFTATSATCVTGLTVFDTYSHWSIFGQIVIISMIQIGGIGFMTVITLLAMFMKRNIGLFSRKILMQSAGSMRIGGVVQLIKRILVGTAVCESAGTVLLSISFCPKMGFWRGMYNAIFHSISAFCNAGFDLMGIYKPNSSLEVFADDVIVNLTIMGLIVAGGLGFLVWSDMFEKKGNLRKFSLNTKIVLSMTTILIVLPTLFFFFVERNHAFADMSTGKAFLISMFHSVSPRTAGFATIDMNTFRSTSNYLTIFLMFIGGSSGSTAGGIKTTTAVVIIISMFATARNKGSVVIGKRQINNAIVHQAYAIFTAYILSVFLCGFVINAIQPELSAKAVLFEVVSAIGTVGLTLGITPQLNLLSKSLVMILMYIGRVGALSIGLAFAERKDNELLSRPEEKILVG